MSDVLILDSGADKIKIGKGFYSDVIKMTHQVSYFHSIRLESKLWTVFDVKICPAASGVVTSARAAGVVTSDESFQNPCTGLGSENEPRKFNNCIYKPKNNIQLLVANEINNLRDQRNGFDFIPKINLFLIEFSIFGGFFQLTGKTSLLD